ncbi:hypothetical protein PP399_23625, partial [Mycobacteroides abscessus]|nr:hypothetical protein [Mycobacteroides abscessus]MDM2073884.1 hypothetical protein [Mycobacteroides abscessus]MDM2078564.1 hypothetical protein [Mycobacteroides abscessus]MDM2092864.1 hypothetical protein [Mycobacteroides abscessus]MDM2141035.1 hypothetical protein [Mycobacteroides abscessus]
MTLTQLCSRSPAPHWENAGKKQVDQRLVTKVDLVGHSQGGLLIKNFVAQDKSDSVANVVQLAPSSHGTTFSGLAD